MPRWFPQRSTQRRDSLDSGLLDEYLDGDQRRTLKPARESARKSGRRRHRASSTSTFPQRGARQDIAAYAREIGVDGERALRSRWATPLAFHALSLDEQGRADPDPAFGRGLPAAADGARAG